MSRFTRSASGSRGVGAATGGVGSGGRGVAAIAGPARGPVKKLSSGVGSSTMGGVGPCAVPVITMPYRRTPRRPTPRTRVAASGWDSTVCCASVHVVLPRVSRAPDV